MPYQIKITTAADSAAGFEGLVEVAFLGVVVQKQEQHQAEEAFQAEVEVEQAFQALEVLSSFVPEVDPSASDQIVVVAFGIDEVALLQKQVVVPEEAGHVASDVLVAVPGKHQAAFAQVDGSRGELHQKQGRSLEEPRAVEQVGEKSVAASSQEPGLQHP